MRKTRHLIGNEVLPPRQVDGVAESIKAKASDWAGRVGEKGFAGVVDVFPIQLVFFCEGNDPNKIQDFSGIPFVEIHGFLLFVFIKKRSGLGFRVAQELFHFTEQVLSVGCT